MYDGTPCLVGVPCRQGTNGYIACRVHRHGKIIHNRHRLAWIDHHGMLPPPETPWILHHCDNRPCENPLHLYAGTAQQNAIDRYCRTGRHRVERVAADDDYVDIFYVGLAEQIAAMRRLAVRRGQQLD